MSWATPTSCWPTWPRRACPPRSFQRVEHSFNPEDLVSGKVEAMAVYTTNEPDTFDRIGFPYDIYSPRAVGIDFYGDNLFTSERELAGHPERVRAFRAASMRGWQWAMSHQEETADLILNKYSRRSDRQHLLYEARQMVPLVREDVTDKKMTEALIWQHANYDALTSLPNRRMFRDRLQHEVDKAERSGSSLAVLFIDLDRFKEVNDTLGHALGDVLLIEAAARIRQCIRKTDTVARLGGDEFTVLAPELDDAAPGRCDRAGHQPRAGRTVRSRRGAGLCLGLDRHHAVPRRRHQRRRPAQARRPGDVRGEGRRARPLLLFHPGLAAGGGEPHAPDARPARRAGRRPVRRCISSPSSTWPPAPCTRPRR
jgi:GGDEF domain-containing protein